MDSLVALRPSITFNGAAITLPDNFRGGPQTDRPNYFGVLEIPIPYEALKTDNIISIQFQDDGGYISSVTLQAYKFSRSIKRSSPTGVDQVRDYLSSDFRIFPNPSNGSINVFRPSDIENSVLTIYTLSGQPVFSQDLSSANSLISVDLLEPGAYISRISTDQFSYSYKLIIQELIP